MTASVLFVGFDAMNAALVEKWARAGKLPNFATLRRDAAAFRLSTFMDVVPGSIWHDIATGRSAAVHGQYYHFDQYRESEGEFRPFQESDIDAGNYVWSVASDAGLRCLAVDKPFMAFQRPFNGIQIREYAQHDLRLGFSTEPAELASELIARYGEVSLQSETCDHFVGHGSNAELLEGLVARARSKRAMMCDLMEQHWDLVFVVMGETHCAGHHFWPQYKSSTEARSFDNLLTIYREMDAALGDFVSAAGPDAQVVVTLSHGLGPYIGGPQLLPEVLTALGMIEGRDSRLRRETRKTLARIASGLPNFLRQRIRRAVGGGTGKIERVLGRNLQPMQSSACLAAAVANNRCGGIRFNLAGRDPSGALDAKDLPDVQSKIISELMALKDPATGETIIEDVRPINEFFDGDLHPDLPDLVVAFRQDLGSIEACTSPSVGTISIPLNRSGYKRTGDHTADNRTYVSAPGFTSDVRGKGNVLDVAPTLLSLLGVPSPKDLSGVPLEPDTPERMSKASRQ